MHVWFAEMLIVFFFDGGKGLGMAQMYRYVKTTQQSLSHDVETLEASSQRTFFIE